MIIEPKFKGSLLLSVHPEGCFKGVEEQINYIKSNENSYSGAKKVLILGASSGYGLATRISLAFGGSKADTIGVSFESGAKGKRLGTAGWYNNIAFRQAAEKEGLVAKNFIGDAFSYEMKEQVIKFIKEEFGGKVDLVIYSLASGRRTDPTDGVTYISALKSTTGGVTGPTINVATGSLEEQTMEDATEEELKSTVKVMGGEDWEMWINQLAEADVLADGARSYAYSYIGPKATYAIYKDGTIGAAKRHLEKTAFKLHDLMQKKVGGQAYITVNKALVTKASAYIPIFPVYAAVLYKVMKEMGLHEGCIEQVHRLFTTMIYGNAPVIDDERRIRPDDWEMREDVQDKVNELWAKVTPENFKELTDYEGFCTDFLQLGGFAVEGVDYSKPVDLEKYITLQP
jgi:enoyl-[acyl-carrier protein] reductase/trans-2-enoyl-CoA reductase (NAD+)